MSDDACGAAAVPLYKRHRFPGEIISHAVWLYYRFLLSRADGQPSPSRVKMAPAPVVGYAVACAGALSVVVDWCREPALESDRGVPRHQHLSLPPAGSTLTRV